MKSWGVGAHTNILSGGPECLATALPSHRYTITKRIRTPTRKCVWDFLGYSDRTKEWTVTGRPRRHSVSERWGLCLPGRSRARRPTESRTRQEKNLVSNDIETRIAGCEDQTESLDTPTRVRSTRSRSGALREHFANLLNPLAENMSFP